jgi:hypothetical protein
MQHSTANLPWGPPYQCVQVCQKISSDLQSRISATWRALNLLHVLFLKFDALFRAQQSAYWFCLGLYRSAFCAVK